MKSKNRKLRITDIKQRFRHHVYQNQEQTKNEIKTERSKVKKPTQLMGNNKKTSTKNKMVIAAYGIMRETRRN